MRSDAKDRDDGSGLKTCVGACVFVWRGESGSEGGQLSRVNVIIFGLI